MEKLIPSHKLDKSQFDDEDSSLENIMTLQTNTKENKKPNVIKWQTFLKDFVTWLVLMFFLYLFWKNVIHKKKPPT